MRQTLAALVLLVHSLSLSTVRGEALATIFDGYFHGEVGSSYVVQLEEDCNVLKLTYIPSFVLLDLKAQVFEIRAKEGPVSVSSFDINLDLENDDERIEIW